MTRAACALGALGAAATLGGCYTEGGPMMSVDRYTYVSTPSQPKSITLVDTRTFESIWSVDIPVGQQIAMQFYKDAKAREGMPPDPMRPDIMRWEMMVAGRAFGELHSAIAVPPAHARRLEMKLRPSPELPDPNAPMPVHQPVQRPAYADESQPEFKKAEPAQPSEAPPPSPSQPPPAAAEPAPAPAPPAEPPVELPPK